MKHKPLDQDRRLYLPRLIHGHTNMESGIISLKERGWPLTRIATEFKVSEQAVMRILRMYGWAE